MLSNQSIIKALIAIMTILILPLSANADDSYKERGITVGASFGIFSNYNNDYHSIIATPRVGYRFNNKWRAGLMLKYQKLREHTTSLAYGAFGQWTAIGNIHEGFRLFIDLSAYNSAIIDTYDYDWDGGCLFDREYSTYHPDDSPKYYPDDDPGYKMFEAGFTPGVAYRFPNSKIDITLRYLFIGFNHSTLGHNYPKGTHGCLGKSDWIIDAGLRRLELGLAINF